MLDSIYSIKAKGIHFYNQYKNLTSHKLHLVTTSYYGISNMQKIVSKWSSSAYHKENMSDA